MTGHVICMKAGKTERFQVPPIIINMLRNKDLLRQYDMSSVKCMFTGAAPLGAETAKELHEVFPKWAIRQGYGQYSPLLITKSATHPYLQA